MGPDNAAEGRYKIHVHRGEDGSHLARLAGEATRTCFRLRDGRAVERLRAFGDRTTVWTPQDPHLPLWRVVTVRDDTGTRTWRIRFLRPAILLPDVPVGGR